MYDAIVVGARCAGSPTAMLLARRGYQVLLVDKSTFPSDVPRSHFIHPPGVALLKRWGLLEKIIASNCPPVHELAFDLGPFVLVGSALPVDGIADVYCPRRTVLDKILVDAAAEAGSELRENFLAEEVLMDGNRVTGIRGQGAGGATVTEQAHVVVGADGMRSLVARTVEAPTYNTKPTLACAYFGYWSGVSIEHAELYSRDHRIIIAFPTNDDLVCIFIEWPIHEFHAFRTDIEGNFLRTIDLVPGLAERVRKGKQEGRFMGSGDLPNFYRKPYGSGWALVGDAGYHKDPYMAHGIMDAFRDAQRVAEAIDAGFSGRRELQEALADYERQRNEETMPIYELNSQLASLEPPPPGLQQLLGALYGNQAETNRFFSAL